MFALEDEKEAVEARFRFLQEQAQVGIFRISREFGEMIEANYETIQMFQCDDLKDLRDYLALSGSRENRFFDPRHFRNLESGDAVSFSMHAAKKDGESFWARVILQSLNDRDYLEGIITDISEQVRMDLELRKAIVSAESARKEAEEANKAKSDFLANISHEIRTPLNGIIGFTEIIMASIDSPQGHLYAGRILDESEKLMTLINQLLDISKIEAKQLQLENTPFYLRNLLADTISFIRLRAKNKGLDLNMDFDNRIPPCILGDSYRIRQILLNLLSNAIKFTNEGEVSLRVLLEKISGDELILRFEIEDTGIGIPDSMHDAVFESFVQADSSISREYGGTGLGISISRELVEIMGGRIWFDSRKNEGTTFFFTIPSRRVEPEAAGEPAVSIKKGLTTLLKGASVLIVEDYPTNREIAQHHLKSAGCLVDMASNGSEALKKAQERRYDLILMDVHMPDMNGLEATRKIRELKSCRNVPIIGMTANVLLDNRLECKEAGMSDFIPKPLRKRELLDLLEFWFIRNRIPFDYSAFLTEMDGDEDTALEIIGGFLMQLDRQLPLLKKAMENRDWEVLHRESHTIKGGALNLGAETLAERAKALEKAAKERNELMVPPLIRKLELSADDLGHFCRETLSGLS